MDHGLWTAKEGDFRTAKQVASKSPRGRTIGGRMGVAGSCTAESWEESEWDRERHGARQGGRQGGTRAPGARRSRRSCHLERSRPREHGAAAPAAAPALKARHIPARGEAPGKAAHQQLSPEGATQKTHQIGVTLSDAVGGASGPSSLVALLQDYAVTGSAVGTTAEPGGLARLEHRRKTPIPSQAPAYKQLLRRAGQSHPDALLLFPTGLPVREKTRQR
jgi:hypothetical protein